MKNAVRNPNPDGEVKESEISEFERENNIKLPEQYRKYLLENNGGSFKKDRFLTKREPGVYHKLLGFFRLNRGPDDIRLERMWNLSEYDLGNYHEASSSYIAIGECAVGLIVLTNLKSGQILIYDPDHQEFATSDELIAHFEVVGETFDEFIENMLASSELPHYSSPV